MSYRFKAAELVASDRTYILTACRIVSRDFNGFPSKLEIVPPSEMLVGKEEFQKDEFYDLEEAEYLLCWVPKVMVPPYETPKVTVPLWRVSNGL